MSKELEAKVWASGLAGHLKPLAAWFADIANPDGTAIYPSIPYACWALGSHDCAEEKPANKRTIQRQIDELLELKVITFIGWRRDGVRVGGTDRHKSAGPGATAEYTLNEGALPWRRRWHERYSEGNSTDNVNGDNLSPIDDGALMVTNDAPNGDKTEGLMVTPPPLMVTEEPLMVTPVSPNPSSGSVLLDPSLNPSTIRRASARNVRVESSDSGQPSARASVDAFANGARARLSGSNYTTWIAPCELVADGPDLVIRAPNSVIRAKLQNGIAAPLKEAARMAGFVSLVVEEKARAPA